MNEKHISTLPIVSDEDRIRGVLTMKDIAINFISSENRILKTSIENILTDMNGTLLCGERDLIIDGEIISMALYYKTIRKIVLLDNTIIAILGDNYDNIKVAIEKRVQLIIITSGRSLPEDLLNLAKINNVPVITLPIDTYETTRKLSLCNYASSIMISKQIIRFKENYYLDEVREDISTFKFANYPVVNAEKKYIGMLNRSHILNPRKKKCIMVDHNEYAQSVLGLKEADVTEIIDHHKIGDIKTTTPISFKNMPVGSTCSIVHSLFIENNIEIPKPIAGLLLSGIISDTMYFKSPTTTNFDRNAVLNLNSILDIDLDTYAYEMFKAGSSLEGQSIKDIVLKDLKEFDIEGLKVSISQVFTLNISEIMENKIDYLNFIDSLHEISSNQITILAITDILQEGSYILYRSDHEAIMNRLSETSYEQGFFMKSVVSRKKQLIPLLSDSVISFKHNL
jgi:manganese-dependent inorganic pyrophosphatase